MYICVCVCVTILRYARYTRENDHCFTGKSRHERQIADNEKRIEENMVTVATHNHNKSTYSITSI